MPHISILMGIYNCAPTLEKAVSSIRTQTYTDWELLLCDDGSSDNTLDLAMRLSQQDSRIRVIQNARNLGLAATLNHCLQEAQGEYVARMDGDDICAPNRLELEIAFLESHPEYAFVSSWMECYDQQGTYGLVRYLEKPCYADFVRGSMFCHAASMLRRDALLSVGGYHVSPSTERVEDYDLWVRLYHAGYRGYNLQKTLYSMCDDRNAFRRRKLKYRLNEARISCRVIKACGLPFTAFRYPVATVCKGFVPGFLYAYIHKRNLGKR